MSERDYPTEEVECPRCDGNGVYDFYDPFGYYETWRCMECAGTGMVTVCANCLDDLNFCSVCNPIAAERQA